MQNILDNMDPIYNQTQNENDSGLARPWMSHWPPTGTVTPLVNAMSGGVGGAIRNKENKHGDGAAIVRIDDKMSLKL